GREGDAGETVRGTPGRNALLARLKELDEAGPYRINVVRRWPDGSLHYLKRAGGEEVGRVYYRDGKTGAERLLVDPDRIARDEGKPRDVHYSLSFVCPSP